MNSDNWKTWWHLFGRWYSTYKENNTTFTQYLSQSSHTNDASLLPGTF